MALLVPTRSTSESFPSVVPLSFLQIPIWEALSKSVPMDKLYELFRVLLKISDEEIGAFLDTQLNQLYQKGVLIREDETPQPSAPSCVSND